VAWCDVPFEFDHPCGCDDGSTLFVGPTSESWAEGEVAPLCIGYDQLAYLVFRPRGSRNDERVTPSYGPILHAKFVPDVAT